MIDDDIRSAAGEFGPPLMASDLGYSLARERKSLSDPTESFGQTATSLARNPLGIIALFIVLVYGFASLVTGFTGSFTAAERLPLIYFFGVISRTRVGRLLVAGEQA